MIVSGLDKIAKLIPQQQPFMLVDSLYDHKDNEVLSGFYINENHILVNEKKQLTEAGIIEHFAQTIALHQGYNYFLKNEPAPVGFIGSIKSFHINFLPKAGEEIKTRIHILDEILGITAVKGEVLLNGECVAHGEMRTVIKK